jgi:Uncharacterized conserved protein (DUF2190)
MSAQSRPLFVLPLLAVTTVPYARLVALTGDVSPLPEMPRAAPISTAGAKALGVSARPVLLGEGFDCICYGTAVIETGAAVTAGQEIASDATGRAIPQSGAARSAGIALQTATAAGEYIEVLLVI